MMGEKQSKDIEELKEVLGVVSKEVPNLIKSIISSIFSEEVGREIGKATAAFYKELRESGISDEVALRLTENYASVFTSLGDIMKKAAAGKKATRDEIAGEVSKKIKEKTEEEKKE